MPRHGKYVVVYDLSDDKERLAVGKVLEGYGFRVQKSVFECLLTPSGRASLVRRLEAKTLASGFVVIYRLHQNADELCLGAGTKPDADAGLAFIV